MSGFRTHMLIGAVAGLVAFKSIDMLEPGALTVSLGGYAVSHGLVGVGCMVVSAYLALWPDIDEPHSYISRRASHFMWFFGAILAFMIGRSMSLPLGWLGLLMLVGAIIGRVVGLPVLIMLSFVSGGHRKLTHSVLLGLAFLIAGWVAYHVRFPLLALPMFAIVWGQFLHLIGDIITPGGVPLFYPLWSRDIHLLPYELSRFGELIIGLIALMIGFVFIWVNV